MIVSISTESILNSEPCPWVVPAQCIGGARNHACSTFQATVRGWNYVAILVERIDFRGADGKAILGFALRAAYVSVYLDVALLVYLEDVPPESFLDFHGSSVSN